MADNTIEYEEGIKDLLTKEIAKILDVEYCKSFNDYISSSYKWYPTRINWKESKCKYNILECDKIDMYCIQEYFNSSCLSNFDEVCFIYSADEPGLIIKLKDAIYNIDKLSKSIGIKYGVHFIVGCKRNLYNIPVLHNNCFAEIDHKYITSPEISNLS